MSRVDMRDLAQQDLPAEEFPARSKTGFRLFLAPAVHRGIQQHAQSDASVEICGVLVGHWKRDEHGPYAAAYDSIRCDNATSKFAEVTFTHESWSHINHEMDSKHADASILGWYHSHPDFGIFLSDRDCFIQENFFSGAGQIAYVVDPVRELEGVFAWQNGKLKLLPHYWIGDEIRTSQASVQSPKTEWTTFSQGQQHLECATTDPTLSANDRSSLSFLTLLLAWTLALLLGYLLASWRTSWERHRIIEGVVAHYGIDKVAKLGLQENLAEIQARLRDLSQDFKHLSANPSELDAADSAALEEKRTRFANNMAFLDAALGSIREEYGLSEEERDSLFRLVAQKHKELQQRIRPPAIQDGRLRPRLEREGASHSELPSEKVMPPAAGRFNSQKHQNSSPTQKTDDATDTQETGNENQADENDENDATPSGLGHQDSTER